MAKIYKLDTDLINHIAAGEVVERPASVLKELVENAIDADATKISIRVKKGGIDLVEVTDDGAGMAEPDLKMSIESHSTSKISEIDDLARIATLGFRGEALASITAVSKVEISTRTKHDSAAHILTIEGGEHIEIKNGSRDVGTTVSVSDLFYNVPARRKFLKTPRTEYRKLIEVFFPIALIHPEIHFTFESEGRKTYNLPAIPDSSPGTLHPQRVKELFSSVEFVEIFFDGEGVLVGGLVAHPEHQKSRTANRYVFINGRPIWDSGIAKSVMVGTSRFVPDGVKIPFLVSITLPYDQVDVNVHPQKSEVRFANPYRIYSAVEAATKRAYEDTLGKDFAGELSDRFRHDGVVVHGERKDSLRSFKDRDAVQATPRYDVKKSIEFSKMILEDAQECSVGEGNAPVPDAEPLQSEIAVDETLVAHQFLNKYIVAQLEDALLIIDQHAAAERIRFEKLLEDYASDGIESQALMIPVAVKLAETEAMFVEENRQIVERLGYEFSVKKDTVSLSSVPSMLAQGDQEGLFRSILDDLQEFEQLGSTEEVLKDKYRDSIVATMACHSSVRMNQRLNTKESSKLVQDLFRCKNSYSCPHGRPIIWRLTPGEIDRHFDR